jgi:hypothetical protein
MLDSWERRLFFLLIATIFWAAAMQIEAMGIVPVHLHKPLSCSYFTSQPIRDVEPARSTDCVERECRSHGI